MTDLQVLELIAQGESGTLEFKRDTLRPEQLAKEIVAFANQKGGTILLGVEDDGSISGIRRPRLQEWLMDSVCGRHIHPRISPAYQEIEIGPEAVIAVITVAEGDSKPYVLRHNDREDICLRHGNITRTATREELVGLLASGGLLQVESLPVPRTSFSSLDLARLENYLQFRNEPELPQSKDKWIELLLQMGFLAQTAEDKLQCTVAGLALFGIKPKRFLKQAGLRVMVFDTPDLQYRARLDVVLDGPMLARWVIDEDGARTIVDDGLVEKLAHTIHPYITIEGNAIDSGFRRPARILYPIEAIRELILNALAHRDWTRSTDIELRIFSDRLQIISPGALPGSMTIAKMKAGQRFARNPVIMEVLREYNYVEERGMGIRTKVIPQVKAVTGKEPEFSADEDCLMITMHRDESTIETIDETLDAPVNASVNETANETANETVNGMRVLSAYQKQLLNMIDNNPYISYEELISHTGRVRTTVWRNLRKLVEHGILTRVGSDKTGYWHINKDIKEEIE